jgi:hypothetical protein
MQDRPPQHRWLKKLWMITEGGCLITTAIIVILTVAFMIFQKFTSKGFYGNQYEGKIVNQGTIIHESRTGSSVEYYLVVVDKNGNRFSVYVTPTLYQRAGIGMWIHKTETEQILSPVIAPRP